MYHVRAQGVDERMISMHYHYDFMINIQYLHYSYYPSFVPPSPPSLIPRSPSASSSSSALMKFLTRL